MSVISKKQIRKWNRCERKRIEILDFLAEKYDDEDILIADGFEEAFIGVASGAGKPSVAAYDYQKCIEILMKDCNVSYFEAVDDFEHNVIAAYMGKYTPVFIDRMD
jgi:hypothetical protein